MVPSLKLQGTKLWANIWREHMSPHKVGWPAKPSTRGSRSLDHVTKVRETACSLKDYSFFPRGWVSLSRQWQTRQGLSKCCWELSCLLIRKQVNKWRNMTVGMADTFHPSSCILQILRNPMPIFSKPSLPAALKSIASCFGCAEHLEPASARALFFTALWLFMSIAHLSYLIPWGLFHL